MTLSYFSYHRELWEYGKNTLKAHFFLTPTTLDD